MDGYVTIGTELDTKSFDRQISQVESELRELEQRYKETQDMSPFKGQDEDLQDLGLQIEKTKNKLVQLNKQQSKLNDTPIQEVEKSYNKIGSTITGIIKKVGKWALAVFGVRTAYNLIRQAISTLSGSNEKIATDLEYIRFALASTLQPVIEWLIQAIYKLLSLLGGVIQSLFGINIFAKATTKAFNKSNKEVAKMRKQLAGFDEANVLGDNTAGAGGGGKTPSFDLSKIKPVDINKLIEDIKLAIPKIFGYIEQFVNNWFDSLTGNANKILEWLGFGPDFIESIDLMISATKNQILGVIKFIEGILQVLLGILTGDKQLIEDGLKNLLDGILHLITGVVFNVVSILKIMINTLWTAFKNGFNLIKGLLAGLFGIITAPIRNGVETAKSVFNNLVSAVRNIASAIKQLFKGDITGAVNNFKSAFSKVFGSLWTIAKSPINLVIEGINALIRGVNRIKFDVPDWVPSIGGKKWGFNIPTIPRLAKGGIINLPGRGVAIGGESGREAVIPLTDSQQMALIGEAIGKYVTINANITNTMNGRVISRELQKINNQNNFAYNR